MPHLCYCDSPDDPFFEYQFQLWFEPEAHYGRWHWAEHVAGLLDGYINVCQSLLDPAGKDWAGGEPIGINFDLANMDSRDRELAIAYAYLKVLIELPSDWVIPSNYSLLEAQATLLSEGCELVVGRLAFPVIPKLPGNDYDALIVSDV